MVYHYNSLNINDSVCVYTTLFILLISLLLYPLCINSRVILNVHIIMGRREYKETWIDKFDAKSNKRKM